MATNWLKGVPPIESPFFEELVDSLGLDDEATRVASSLNRDGLAVLTFPEPEFDRIADRLLVELEPFYAENRQKWGSRPERLFDAWRSNDSVRRLAANRDILDLLTRLYGRDAFPFQTNNFRVGSQQGVHSDAVHFQTVPERFVAAVWVALEDTDESNGPLIYWPGSHRLPIYSNEHVGVPAGTAEDPYAHHERFSDLWRELVRLHGLECREVHLKKGQAAIWAANLFHGGAPRKDPARTRHSQATHYMFKGCAYYTPLQSIPFAGRILFRRPVSIDDGVPQANTVNDIPVPEDVIQAALRAATDPHAPGRDLDLCTLERRFEPRHLPPQGLQVGSDFLLLHPNAPGTPPATLVVPDIGLDGERYFVSTLEIAHERSGPVEFGIEVRDAEGREVAARSQRLAGGGRMELRVELPRNLSRCSLTLTTRMARKATSSQYAWARFLRPRFSVQPDD